jgi:hypothetical protein
MPIASTITATTSTTTPQKRAAATSSDSTEKRGDEVLKSDAPQVQLFEDDFDATVAAVTVAPSVPAAATGAVANSAVEVKTVRHSSTRIGKVRDATTHIKQLLYIACTTHLNSTQALFYMVLLLCRRWRCVATDASRAIALRQHTITGELYASGQHSREQQRHCRAA